jgi:NAD(P)-dependent dehydrogenase (short-subunit alcohol dehydrogenase family)
MSLDGKLMLITGAARRIGRALSLAVAQAGGDVVIHYGQSHNDAQDLADQIHSLGRKAYLLKADFEDPDDIHLLIPKATKYGQLFALVNNAGIFQPLTWQDTTLENWQQHMMINLTAPFLLSQAFARQVPENGTGRIVNMLDWRALRPAANHFPYSISKAALAALTQSLAIALAPRITVNGLALGAVLPPSQGKTPENILKNVPTGRWADLDEICQALIFLLDGPAYITGEMIHVDGGRHLV